jgi:hypothetical protein
MRKRRYVVSVVVPAAATECILRFFIVYRLAVACTSARIDAEGRIYTACTTYENYNFVCRVYCQRVRCVPGAPLALMLRTRFASRLRHFLAVSRGDEKDNKIYMVNSTARSSCCFRYVRSS